MIVGIVENPNMKSGTLIGQQIKYMLIKQLVLLYGNMYIKHACEDRGVYNPQSQMVVVKSSSLKLNDLLLLNNLSQCSSVSKERRYVIDTLLPMIYLIINNRVRGSRGLNTPVANGRRESRNHTITTNTITSVL
jgi:hypothetical protein